MTGITRQSPRSWWSWAAMLLLLGGGSVALAAGPAPADPQQTLDFLAILPLDQAKQPELPPPPPGPFASWTADQQRDYPGKLRLICASFWSFIHPPEGRLLPAAVPDTDERDVGVNVCLLGHMPSDWPGRARTLQETKAIFARVKAAGSPLLLPSAIKP